MAGGPVGARVPPGVHARGPADIHRQHPGAHFGGLSLSKHLDPNSAARWRRREPAGVVLHPRRRAALRLRQPGPQQLCRQLERRRRHRGLPPRAPRLPGHHQPELGHGGRGRHGRHERVQRHDCGAAVGARARRCVWRGPRAGHGDGGERGLRGGVHSGRVAARRRPLPGCDHGVGRVHRRAVDHPNRADREGGGSSFPQRPQRHLRPGPSRHPRNQFPLGSSGEPNLLRLHGQGDGVRGRVGDADAAQGAVRGGEGERQARHRGRE
mmetsp:Transcript_46369/g.88524  ORF Transcript_46369/g.88524 Transcript_46369/m.88524 type:complete len:267 (+) Transcript_46369:114-914(+)